MKTSMRNENLTKFPMFPVENFVKLNIMFNLRGQLQSCEKQ